MRANEARRRATVLLAALASVSLLAFNCCARRSPQARPPASPPGGDAARADGLYALPHVTLVALTDWQAVLAPCGCTIDLQRGGIERISWYLNKLRASDDSVHLVHAGPLFAGDHAAAAGRAAQDTLRQQTFAQGLARLQLTAAALASADLTNGETARGLIAKAPWPVLASGDKGGIARAQSRVLITTASGAKVGYTAADSGAKSAADSHAAVRAQVEALRADGADIVVVLSNLGLRGSRRLARAVAGIDAIVVGGVPDRIEPDLDPVREGRTLLVQATRHGAWVATVTLARNGERTGRWHDVPEWLPDAVAVLDGRIAAADSEIERLRTAHGVSTRLALSFYRRQLEDLRARRARALAIGDRSLPRGSLAAYRAVDLPWSNTVDTAMAELVARYDAQVAKLAETHAAPPLPARPGEAAYVGGAACMGCHSETRGFVAEDPHYRAWKTLEVVGKTRDLDCVPCHVTGFGKPGGSAISNLTAFVDVQCEACHGPGSTHVGSPQTAHLTARPGKPVCRTCHTAEHAPRFDFAAQVRALRVPGHGLRAKAAEAPP